jgi:hypothetical protein
MSFPTIPDIDPAVLITQPQAVNLLLASVAFEELGLAHVINAEAEKLQSVLGTLPENSVPATTIGELLIVNREVRRTLQTVIKSQMLLQFKLENILEIGDGGGGGGYAEAGSAWSVGTSFGHGNAQYTTLAPADASGSTILGLGHNYIDVGTVAFVRSGTDLLVTISTNTPYVMSENHLYVSNVAPTDSNPGGFPFQYTVSDPIDYFTSHTFTVPVGAWTGQTLYIAAHAKILITA